MNQVLESDSENECENVNDLNSNCQEDDTNEEYFSCSDEEKELKDNDVELLPYGSDKKISVSEIDSLSEFNEPPLHAVSVRSFSTASTIAPEVVKARVRKALISREKKELRKRVVAKGEASATTRNRRENRETIKECDGIWGWD